MIPLDLVKVIIRKGKIRPAFMSKEEKGLAVEVIEAFRSCIGKKRRELEDRLELLEEIYDYRRVRGLAALLERYCVFTSPVEEAWKLRRLVFTEAERIGGVYNEEERRNVIKAIAEREGLVADELEKLLWADLNEEKVLKSFEPPRADELVREYNLSLFQSILLRGVVLEFLVERGWRDILWAAKRLGLMYEAYLSDEGPIIKVQGPASLLRLTERYGSSLAKLLPHIVRHSGWKVRAKVIWRTQGTKRYLELELDHSSAKSFLPSYPMEKVKFDSEVEERFYREFVSLRSGWEIRREAEVLVVDSGIYLPDFVFLKDGLKVYLEIMGFWTEDYLKRKLKKLKKLKDVKFIIAAHEELSCSEIREVGHEVILFRDRVRAEMVFRLLKRLEEENMPKLISTLIGKEMKIEGDLVDLTDIHPSVKAMKEAIRLKPVKGYRLIGEQLVSDRLLRRIDAELSKVKGYYDAARLISRYGIKDIASLLHELGYEVVWKSLDGSDAIIKKLE